MLIQTVINVISASCGRQMAAAKDAPRSWHSALSTAHHQGGSSSATEAGMMRSSSIADTDADIAYESLVFSFGDGSRGQLGSCDLVTRSTAHENIWLTRLLRKLKMQLTEVSHTAPRCHIVRVDELSSVMSLRSWFVEATLLWL